MSTLILSIDPKEIFDNLEIVSDYKLYIYYMKVINNFRN